MGQVSIEFNNGQQLPANLADISFYGVGFDIQFRDVRRVKTGGEIRFHCPWNPKLLGSSRYVVRSVKGQRIGAERMN